MKFLIEKLYTKRDGVDIFYETRQLLYSKVTNEECNYPIRSKEDFFRYLDAVDSEGRYIKENDITHADSQKRQDPISIK